MSIAKLILTMSILLLSATAFSQTTPAPAETVYVHDTTVRVDTVVGILFAVMIFLMSREKKPMKADAIDGEITKKHENIHRMIADLGSVLGSRAQTVEAKAADTGATVFEETIKLIDEAEAEDAIREFEALIRTMDIEGISRDQIPGTTLRNIALNYSRVGKWKDAANILEDYVRALPDDADAYFLQAFVFDRLFEKTKDMAFLNLEVIALESATIHDPEFTEAFNNWGIALSDLAEQKSDIDLFEQACGKYKKAIEIKPDYHEAYYNWGNELSDLAKQKSDIDLFEQAFEKYKKAVEIKPDCHEAYYNWGIALSDLAEQKSDIDLFEKACGKYKRAIEIKPDKHEAFNSWGLALSEVAGLTGESSWLEQAFEKYKKAIEIKPDDHDAFYNWGNALSDLAEQKSDIDLFAQAFEKYKKAIEIKPDDQDAFCNWGFTLSKMAQMSHEPHWFDLAHEKLDKALLLKSDAADVHFNKAWVYALQEMKSETLACLKRAVELDPNFRSEARKDEDFKAYLDDPDFKALVGEPDEEPPKAEA